MVSVRTPVCLSVMFLFISPEKQKLAASGSEVRVQVKQPSASTKAAAPQPQGQADRPPRLELPFRLDESVTNKLAPADEISTSKAADAVRINVTSSGPNSLQPVSIPFCFRQTVQNIPQAAAMGRF